MRLALAGILALTALPAISRAEIADHEPDWQARLGQQPNALIDADTGQPFVLTERERALCVRAMEAADMGNTLYHRVLEHLRRGEQVVLGDVVMLNRPLMYLQMPKYNLTDADIAVIKPLLDRLRKSAAAMVSPK